MKEWSNTSEESRSSGNSPHHPSTVFVSRAFIRFLNLAALTCALSVLATLTDAHSSPSLSHGDPRTSPQDDAPCEICFYGPDNIAFDADENAYVTDGDQSARFRVLKISASGKKLMDWHAFMVAPNRRNGPEGIAVSNQNEIFVTDGGALQVIKFSAHGRPMMRIGDKAPVFQDLGHVAVDKAGNIFVAEGGVNRIQQFSPRGKRLTVWQKPKGHGENEWNMPEGIGLQPNGNIVVEDAGNQRVLIVNANGDTVSSIDLKHLTPHFSAGLAVDAIGNIYVADDKLHSVQMFDPKGSWIRNIANGDHDLLFRSGPTSISVGPHDILYAADGRTVVKFTVDGELLGRWR
ncbi:MAG TPA: NHL repeat-containing protein [Steroidobacteraceae bacterium]